MSQNQHFYGAESTRAHGKIHFKIIAYFVQIYEVEQQIHTHTHVRKTYRLRTEVDVTAVQRKLGKNGGITFSRVNSSEYVGHVTICC